MRKYYLFIIKTDFYDVYKNNSYVLYKTLENLWNIKSHDFSYGLSLYDALCQTFDVPILNKYLKDKYYHRIKSSGNRHVLGSTERTCFALIEVNYSATVVITNVNFPSVLKDFYYYNKRIFVCDFMNEDYFWLNNQYK